MKFWGENYKISMNKGFFSFGLVAMLATFFAVIPGVNAELGFRDPKQYNCNDAQTLDFKEYNYTFPRDTRVYGSRNSRLIRKGEVILITVNLRSSKKCQGKWVRTTPGLKDTQLSIEDKNGVLSYIAC